MSMAKITYEVAYRDHKYLWSISPARDMTGGYVDQEDLERMLKTPTKAMAAKCLSSQIQYWFERGTESGAEQHVSELLESDDEIRAIYSRHVGRLEDRDDD